MSNSPCLKNHSCDPENKLCSSAVQNRDNSSVSRRVLLFYIMQPGDCNVTTPGMHLHLHNPFPPPRKLHLLPSCALTGDERLSTAPSECANTYRVKTHGVKECVFSSTYECRLQNLGHLIWIGILRSSFWSKLNF